MLKAETVERPWYQLWHYIASVLRLGRYTMWLQLKVLCEKMKDWRFFTGGTCETGPGYVAAPLTSVSTFQSTVVTTKLQSRPKNLCSDLFGCGQLGIGGLKVSAS